VVLGSRFGSHNQIAADLFRMLVAPGFVWVLSATSCSRFKERGRFAAGEEVPSYDGYDTNWFIEECANQQLN
jgi:hypothetical protein